MRRGETPFRFDISDVLTGLARRAGGLPSAIQIDLPFLSVLVHPSAQDVRLARELLVKMRDRRVLDHQECCDSCIDQALASLQQIRAIILDVQVQLAGDAESALSPLAQLMALSIRQFLTFEQTLERPVQAVSGDGRRRPWETQEAYFDALEQLRGHLSRCLGQIAVIAGVEGSSDGLLANYRGPWQIDAYVTPAPLATVQR